MRYFVQTRILGPGHSGASESPTMAAALEAAFTELCTDTTTSEVRIIVQHEAEFTQRPPIAQFILRRNPIV